MEFRNYLLTSIADLKIPHLQSALADAPLQRGDSVLEVGSGVEYVYFPSSALLSVVTSMEDGRSVETSTVGCETAVPLLTALARQPSQSRIFVQIGGGATRINAATLRRIAADHHELMSLLLRHAGAAALQAEQGVACNALHGAPARLSRWLLMTQDRTGAMELELTQEYMAIMTGVQRTTISAVANELRDEGLIKFSRGRVTITNRRGLQSRACECYGIVRQAFDNLGVKAKDEAVS
jgi:CRP-like cAMP-binding protein